MTDSSLSRRHLLHALGGVTLAVPLAGCRDKMKEVQPLGDSALEALLPIIERDTKQIRDGLPKGAVELAKHLDEDPSANREGLRTAIVKARESVKELVVAKSTFFVFVGTDGVVKRAESDPDLAADKSLVEAVPETKAMLDKSEKLVEVFGYMEGLRGVNKGNEMQWIVGSPVVVEGDLKGAFVTGFSLRRYAEVLENTLKAKLTEASEKNKRLMPLFYNFILKGDKAYGTAVTPDGNMAAVAEQNPVANMQGGSFTKEIEVEGRSFYLAAKPAPALAKDAAVAIMLSPV